MGLPLLASGVLRTFPVESRLRSLYLSGICAALALVDRYRYLALMKLQHPASSPEGWALLTWILNIRHHKCETNLRFSLEIHSIKEDSALFDRGTNSGNSQQHLNRTIGMLLTADERVLY